MKPNIDKEFYLTRGEYAKKINKSKGSVIQLMRRGKLNNEYIIKNDWYYFRDPSRERANKTSVYGPIYTPKKKYNRGNHDNANYPNASFREHNAMKRLAAAQYKVPKDIQDKLPKAIELVKEEERRSRQSNVRASISSKNYGGFLTQSQMLRGDFEPTRGKEIKHKKGPYEI